MIDVAERLMAERGIGVVSLRQVQRGSGQRNKSAAQYHFGSREGLIAAIVETRMAPINERRLALLAELDAAGRGEDPRRLVEALVLPLAEVTGVTGSTYARFLAQALADPSASSLVGAHLRAESFRQVCERLMLHGFPTDVPHDLRVARVDRVVSLVIISLAAWEAGRFPDRLRMAARLSDLVDVCVGMLHAPVSAGTRAAMAEDRSPSRGDAS